MNLPSDLEYQLRMADAHTPPSSPDDLHSYVKSYLGYSVPRTAVCRNHVSPSHFLSSVYFGNCRNAVAFANRGGGKTLSVAILCHLKAIHNELFQVANVASEKTQARRCYDYIKAFSDTDNPWFAQDRVFSTLTRTKFRNGSSLEILTGTLSGCKSAHPHLVTCDEVDVMDWAVIQEVLLMAQSTKEHERIQVFLSTRQFVSGNMHKLLDVLPKQPSWPFTTFSWCIFETIERCERSSCDECKQTIRFKDDKPESWYDVCHEEPERYSDGKCRASDGYILLKDVLEDFSGQDFSTFDTQKRCLRPGRMGLVFGSFDEEIHCKPQDVEEWKARLHKDRFERPITGRNEQGAFVELVPRELEIAIVLDMGWTDPLAVLFIAKDQRDNLFCFDSIYQRELDLRDLKPMLLEKLKKYNIPPDFEMRCDQRASREIDDLNKMGFKVTAVGLEPNERMRLIRKWLSGGYREGYPTICVDPETCPDLCDEFNLFKFPMGRDKQPKSDKYPDKGPNHLLDDLGYSMNVFGLATGGTIIAIHRSKEPPRPPPVVPTRPDWTRWRM